MILHAITSRQSGRLGIPCGEALGLTPFTHLRDSADREKQPVCRRQSSVDTEPGPNDMMADPAMQPCLVLVAGGAGSGKTHLAKALVHRVANAVLLDKDRLLGWWVDRVLTASGVGADRDNAFYWREIRPQEYATLETIAFDHLDLGKIVVIDAPLRPELQDPSWVQRIRGECVVRGAGFVAIWMLISAETARRRMEARAEPRDHWKLANWEEFLRRQPYDPPAGATIVLPNDDGDAVQAGLERLLSVIAGAAPRKKGCLL